MNLMDLKDSIPSAAHILFTFQVICWKLNHSLPKELIILIVFRQ